MIEKFQKAYEQTVTTTRIGLIGFRAPEDSTITELIIYCTISLQTTIFNLRVNGTPLFAGGGRPSVTAGGDAFVVVSGLSEVVDQGDLVTLDVDQASQGGVSGISFQVTFDNGSSGIPPGGADGDVLTKQSGADYDADWEAPTGGGGGSIGTFLADAPFATPGAEDDEFDAGTLDAKWSFMGAGQGPLVVTSGYAGSFLKMIPDVSDYPNLRGIYQPTTDVDQAWVIKLHPGRNLGSSDWQGLMIGDTGTAHAWWGYVYDPNDKKIKSIGYTSSTTPNSGPTDVGTLFTTEHEVRGLYIKVRYVSSTKTVYGYVSTDGINYYLVGSQGTNGGGGANRVGIVCYGGETTNVHLIDWFRRLQGSIPFTGRVV